jgi:hypothetical protein
MDVRSPSSKLFIHCPNTQQGFQRMSQEQRRGGLVEDAGANRYHANVEFKTHRMADALELIKGSALTSTSMARSATSDPPMGKTAAS